MNNAGATRDNLLARMKDEDWDDIQATNLKSVFLLSRAVLRAMMKARAGRIVNVSSVVGFTGNLRIQVDRLQDRQPAAATTRQSADHESDQEPRG